MRSLVNLIFERQDQKPKEGKQQKNPKNESTEQPTSKEAKRQPNSNPDNRKPSEINGVPKSPLSDSSDSDSSFAHTPPQGSRTQQTPASVVTPKSPYVYQRKNKSNEQKLKLKENKSNEHEPMSPMSTGMSPGKIKQEPTESIVNEIQTRKQSQSDQNVFDSESKAIKNTDPSDLAIEIREKKPADRYQSEDENNKQKNDAHKEPENVHKEDDLADRSCHSIAVKIARKALQITFSAIAMLPAKAGYDYLSDLTDPNSTFIYVETAAACALAAGLFISAYMGLDSSFNHWDKKQKKLEDLERGNKDLKKELNKLKENEKNRENILITQLNALEENEKKRENMLLKKLDALEEEVNKLKMELKQQTDLSKLVLDCSSRSKNIAQGLVSPSESLSLSPTPDALSPSSELPEKKSFASGQSPLPASSTEHSLGSVVAQAQSSVASLIAKTDGLFASAPKSQLPKLKTEEPKSFIVFAAQSPLPEPLAAQELTPAENHISKKKN